MKNGAVAMMDAVGFRALSQSDPDVLRKKLLNLQGELTRTASEVESLFQNAEGTYGVKFSSRAVFLSDTVVIAVYAEGGDAGMETVRTSGALAVVATLAARFIAETAKTAPRIIYRGCISFGEVEVHDNFLFGRAVDRAATNMETANGAFVWMDPEARDAFGASHNWSSGGMNSPVSDLYDVPLKQGGECHTRVVTPFRGLRNDASRLQRQKDILATFDSRSLDVDVKRRATEKFLEADRARLGRIDALGAEEA